MSTRKEKQADLFVSELTHVEDSYLKLVILAGLWAGGMFVALGPLSAAIWFALAFTVISIPKFTNMKTAVIKKPFSRPGQIFAFVSAVIWGLAPFSVWQATEGKYDTLAITMLGIGFLLVVNKYRTMPKPAMIIAAPYFFLIFWFLYESRMSSVFILGVVAAVAYLATLGGFLYTGYQSKKAIIAYKLEQDELRAELERARDEAENASQAKSSFLANMSHELRTPLNGILGLSDVLLGEDMPRSQHMKLGLIRDSGKNLLALLNDILDISKIEADNVELDPTPYEVETYFKKNFAFWKPLADEKKVNLVYQKQKDLPSLVSIDSLRLRQCVNNLINNALKFTPENGQVTVTLTGREVDGRYALSYSIRDTGIGISLENMEKLFKPFSQAEMSTTRKFGGSGLGLMIARKICRLMGGDITVQSVVGEGSIFKITVMSDIILANTLKNGPEEPAIAKTKPAVKTGLDGMRCLVVEDNDINLEVLLLLLEPYDLTFDITRNGKEAIAALDQTALDKQEYDFVLMDLQMPVLGGMETTQIIRGGNKPYANVPIIAMTANAMAGDRRACLAAGMNNYISKPLTRASVAQIIAETTNNALGGTAPVQKAGS